MYNGVVVTSLYYRHEGSNFDLPLKYEVRRIAEDVVTTDIQASGLLSINDSKLRQPAAGDRCWRYDALFAKQFGGALKEVVIGLEETGLWKYGLTSSPGSCGSLVCDAQGSVFGVHSRGGGRGSDGNYFVAFPENIPEFFRFGGASHMQATLRVKSTNSSL
jgi:hypothetical protein